MKKLLYDSKRNTKNFILMNSKSILILLFLLTSLKSFSQLKITNSAKEPLWICIAYKSKTSNFNGWVSEGWWKVIPGETTTLGNYKITNGENTFYFYAYYGSGDKKKQWGGDTYFAVSSDAFKIINADKQYVLKENKDYRQEGFKEKRFYIGILDPLTYNFSLIEN
ncbi:MAG: hypothetical protein RL264_2668 [Bacteroidota bacterium]|jgi:uncharacterized membrane protein